MAGLKGLRKHFYFVPLEYDVVLRLLLYLTFLDSSTNTFNSVYMQCVSRQVNVPCVCVLQFNFVGRILGPRGLTAKQLEAETGCKIMVRGKGSMRDKKKVSTYTSTHIAHASRNAFYFKIILLICVVM